MKTSQYIKAQEISKEIMEIEKELKVAACGNLNRYEKLFCVASGSPFPQGSYEQSLSCDGSI